MWCMELEQKRNCFSMCLWESSFDDENDLKRAIETGKNCRRLQSLSSLNFHNSGQSLAAVAAKYSRTTVPYFYICMRFCGPNYPLEATWRVRQAEVKFNPEFYRSVMIFSSDMLLLLQSAVAIHVTDTVDGVGWAECVLKIRVSCKLWHHNVQGI